MNKIYTLTVIIGIISILLIFPSCSLYFLVFLLVTISTIAFASISIIWSHLALSDQHETKVEAENLLKYMENYRNEIMHSYRHVKDNTKSTSPNYPIIAGKTVDTLIKQVLDFFVRDFIFYYIKDNAYDAEALCEKFKEDLWCTAKTLQERLSKIDHIKLIAGDIVTKITLHFEKIREAKAVAMETNQMPIFTVSPHVESEVKEIEFLRSFSEVLILLLLPTGYSISPTKYLIRECLIFKLFQPLIDQLTDPDFLNQKIILYIENKNSSSNVNAFECAKTFEDFLKIIRNADNVDDVISIRYDIVNKLMQATTLQNLNRTKGVDLDNEKASLAFSGVNRADINAAKKLKKYINQLTFAKKECEQQLYKLDQDCKYKFKDQDQGLHLQNVLEHVLGRKYLTQFLETLASQDLIRFWLAIEELRTAQRKNWHQIGAEIFYTFIRNSTSAAAGEIKVDQNTKKKMEGFLLGDGGPEIFYEVQNQIVRIIENKYYQSFLLSDHYKEMLNAMRKEDKLETDFNQSWEERQSLDSTNSDSGSNVGDHNNYTKRKLDQLQEKCFNKFQALQTLRASLRPDSKVLGILEKEVEWLQGEKRQLEAHINRTEIWGENLGKWRAVVQSVEIPDEKETPQFVIVVHMLENDDAIEGEESISTGWVVCRSLYQFQELHRKLRSMCLEIKSLELPTTNTFKFLFGKTDKCSLDKAKQQIQKYLDYILQDDKLNQSEAIYSFLSPSPDQLKQTSPIPKKKNKFSFSTLFKSGGSEQQSSKDTSFFTRESEDENLCFHTFGSNDVPDSNKINGHKLYEDSIAEPLYSLLSELFDMRGVFKYLRKTLIGFVQISYGNNINRQIHDTIEWWFSEQMLHYYVTLLLKNFWPGGTLSKPYPSRTEDEKLETKLKAKELFLNNIPELLTTLVGSTAAKNGAIKIFSVMQDKTMNKQLFYEILELAIETVFPELK